MKKRHQKIFLITISTIILGILTYGFILLFVYVFPNSSSVLKKQLCKDCNVVLITLDVCSARNIPCYGYGRNTTPNLCAYAKENQLFLNAYANGEWTLPSRVSLFTGVLPSTHGVNGMWTDSLSTKRPFLPDILQQNGYETILMQDKDSGIFPVKQVYYRGVSEIIEDYYITDIVDHLEKGNAQNKKMFVSYYSAPCHEPNLVGSEKKLYTTDSFPNIPLEENDTWENFPRGFYDYLLIKLPEGLKNNAFSSKTEDVKKLYVSMQTAQTYENTKKIFLESAHALEYTIITNLYWSYIYENFIDVKNEKMMEYLRALYDEKLAQTDENDIKNFINKLDKSPTKKNTIVLITSEHGQEFGEHGVFGHTTLYDRNLKVPFILSVPNISPGVYTEKVQGIDVTPTILDLIGIDHTITFEGKSILPIIRHQTFPDRYIITDKDGGVKKAIQKGEWKLLVARQNDDLLPYELFNVISDPNEEHNLIYSRGDIVRKMLKESNVHLPTGKDNP